jgi:hypothetical protein
MTKKKKPTVQKFIAIDNGDDRIIDIGTLNEIKEAIEDHTETYDYDESDVASYIEVYELGKKMEIQAMPKGLEVYIH